jgi:hypothetical protein
MSQSAQQPPQPQAPAPGPYPYYPYYGYYPWYAQQQPTQPPTPAERPTTPERARLANLVISLVLAVATVGAIALAAAAPSFAERAPSPASVGLQQVYDAPLTNDPDHWDVSQGCVFELGGLHATNASSGTVCPFKPSIAGDITSGGFLLTATVGPAGAVNSQQEPCISLSDGSSAYELTFDQNGAYTLDPSPENPCGDTTSRDAAIGGTVAWHVDGFTPNDVSVRYSAADQTLTVYANGQRVVHGTVNFSGQVKIALGARGNGEAVFTHFTLYGSGSA